MTTDIKLTPLTPTILIRLGALMPPICLSHGLRSSRDFADNRTVVLFPCMCCEPNSLSNLYVKGSSILFLRQQVSGPRAPKSVARDCRPPDCMPPDCRPPDCRPPDCRPPDKWSASIRFNSIRVDSIRFDSIDSIDSIRLIRLIRFG